MSATLIPVTVVVAFYSRCGTTEARALAAAVGSVNARALIRMRRMPDATSPASEDGECAAEAARMRKEYVPPTEADIAGADALVVAVPTGLGAASAEWAPLHQALSALSARGALTGKVAAVVSGGDDAANAAFATALNGLGFTMVEAPPPADGPAGSQAHARAHGRLVAETSRALKSSR
jgi:NAD(P)H dehydrogenase (quinone)